MKKEPIAEVTIRFDKEPGGLTPTAADAVAWVEAHMRDMRGEPEGCNSFRYSEAVVVAVKIL